MDREKGLGAIDEKLVMKLERKKACDAQSIRGTL